VGNRGYDYASAIRTFRRYLVDAAGDLTPDQRREISALVDEMQGAVARIRVTASVAGARILLDGEDAGTSPLAYPVTVVPGRHVVEARLEGYEDAREEVRARTGETAEVSFTLVALPEPPPQVVVVERPAPPDMPLPPDLAPVEPPPEEEPSVFETWWFWTIVGALAVGGGVTAGVLLWPEEGRNPDWVFPVR
jgi:hypothetical protein